MERLRKERRPLRAAITKTVREASVLLAAEEPDQLQLKLKYRKLLKTAEKVAELDSKILDALLDAEVSEEVYLEEADTIEKYDDDIEEMKAKIDRVLIKSRPPSPVRSEYHSVSNGGRMKTYKLPKIEVKKFDGEWKNWLGFWAQFQKIDEDEDLHSSDKLQYLLQAMVEGSKAMKLVESYPQTAENYPKVVRALKDRFGDKVMLSEVYVRELLKFVNTGLSKSSSLSSVYDELEAHLRALESLGVTTNQSAIFLYPMVESSLPMELIKVWQRSSLSGYGEGEEVVPADRLKQLMVFLRQEVKGEERLAYVTKGMMDSSKQKKKTFLKEQSEDEDIPTVAGLFVGNKQSCVFCDKGHESKDCWEAQTMSLQNKSELVREKRCCFTCLRPGHQSKMCKTLVRCPVCQKKHQLVMCPEIQRQKSEEENHTEVVASNLVCSSEVLLKTLQVKVAGPKGTRVIRALLDDGSQRSYITRRVAEDVGLVAETREKIQHTLFGGVQTDVQWLRKFQVKLNTLRGNKSVFVEALEKEEICSELPRLRKGAWVQQLADQGIIVNDVGEGRQPVDMLLGARELTSLLTGNTKIVGDKLLALETHLGWCLMGNSPRREAAERNDTNAMLVTCMHVSQSTVEQRRNLETVGIGEHVKSKLRRSDEGNPSDTPSRGCSPKQLVELRWWEGLKFLKLPSGERKFDETELNEEKVHQRNGHGEWQLLKGRPRDREWILRRRKTDQKCVGRCVIHRRHAAKKKVPQELKMRFRKEYLSQLVHHGKMRKEVKAEPEDVVRVGADKKRWEWPLAKIVKLIPWKYGVARVAKIKAATGVWMRRLQRPYPLEVSSRKLLEVKKA